MPRFQGIPVEDPKPRFAGEAISDLPEAKPMGADIPRGGLTPTGQEFVREALPIVGAGALTMAAPGAGIPALMGLGALGAAGGEAAGQLYDISRGKQPLTPTEALKGMGKEAALGAAAEGIMGGAMKVGGKLLKPKTARGERVLDLAKEAGLPVSRTRIEPKATTRIFGAAADLTPAGRIVGDHYRKQLVKETSKYADDFTQTLNLAKTGKEEVAAGIGKQMESIKDFSTAYKPWNDLIEQAAKEQHGEVLLEDARDLLMQSVSKKFEVTGNKSKAIKEVIEDYGFKINSKEGLILKRIFEDEVATPKDLKAILSKVWKDYGKQADIAVKRRQALKDVLIQDVQRQGGKTNLGEMAAEAKAAGDAVYRDVAEFLKKSPNVREFVQPARIAPGLKRYEYQPEMMVERLVRRGSADELLELKTRIATQPAIEGAPAGKEIWNGIKFQYINDLVEQAMTTNAKTGERVFLPAKFSDLVEKNTDTIQRVFPDVAEKVQDFAAMSKGIAPEFEAAGGGLVDRLTGPGLVQAGLLAGADPTATVVVNGFGSLVAYGMLSNAGKKALSKYLLKPAGKVFKETVARPALMLGGEELTL